MKDVTKLILLKSYKLPFNEPSNQQGQSDSSAQQSQVRSEEKQTQASELPFTEKETRVFKAANGKTYKLVEVTGEVIKEDYNDPEYRYLVQWSDGGKEWVFKQRLEKYLYL